MEKLKFQDEIQFVFFSISKFGKRDYPRIRSKHFQFSLHSIREESFLLGLISNWSNIDSDNNNNNIIGGETHHNEDAN